MTQEYLKRKFTYCRDTGFFTKNSTKKRTTYITSTGYKRVVIDGTPYREHILAWLYEYGKFPNGIIDHINRIKTDNRICNLRIVTHSENQMNTNIQKNNKSGTTGVYYRTSKKRWIAKIKKNYKSIHIGSFLTKEDAIIARNKYSIEQ